MDLPSPVAPKNFKKHEVSIPHIFLSEKTNTKETLIKPYMPVSSQITFAILVLSQWSEEISEKYLKRIL